jgi:hypothetical protein
MKTASAPRAKTPSADHSVLVRKRLAELRTLRDEIRLKLNLAGKEARDRWRKLEARVEAAENHVRGARRQSARSLSKLVEDLRRFRNHLLEIATPMLRIC